MASLVEKHRGLIASTTRLYALLVRMRFLASADVSHPPHALPPVNAALLRQTVGFDAEVVDLLVQALPALRPNVTWGRHMSAAQIAPRSIAVSYLDPNGAGGPGQLDESVFDYIRSGGPGAVYRHYAEADDADLLPPWMFRLTFAEHSAPGLHLIYNVQDQSITEWTTMTTPSWQESPSRPAATVMDEISGKLRTLEWVPYYEPQPPTATDEDGYHYAAAAAAAAAEPAPRREIVENPLVVENIQPLGFISGSAVPLPLPLDDHAALLAQAQRAVGGGSAAAAEEGLLRERLNRWLALRKLYRDCGWGSSTGSSGGDDDDNDEGDDGFDADEFEIRRRDLIMTARRLHAERLDAQAAARPSREEMAALMRDDPDLERRILQDHHGDASFLMLGAQREARDEAERRVRDFWRERAGDQAV